MEERKLHKNRNNKFDDLAILGQTSKSKEHHSPKHANHTLKQPKNHQKSKNFSNHQKFHSTHKPRSKIKTGSNNVFTVSNHNKSQQHFYSGAI